MAKKKDSVFMKRLLMIVALLLLPFVFVQSSFASTSITGKRIVLDSGHGGSDSGAVNQDLKESDVTLDIANRLKAKLETDGAIVGMTRTCDCTKSNADRYNYANAFGGDVLLSIHLNGSTNPSMDGTLGLYGKASKDKAFTDAIHSSLVSGLGIPDRGETNFASGVLLKSNMPATIAETVFLTSSYEYSLLKAGTRQQEIADGLYQGLLNYFTPSPTIPPVHGRK